MGFGYDIPSRNRFLAFRFCIKQEITVSRVCLVSRAFRFPTSYD
jgi:hypothetical protein